MYYCYWLRLVFQITGKIINNKIMMICTFYAIWSLGWVTLYLNRHASAFALVKSIFQRYLNGWVYMKVYKQVREHLMQLLVYVEDTAIAGYCAILPGQELQRTQKGYF